MLHRVMQSVANHVNYAFVYFDIFIFDIFIEKVPKVVQVQNSKV